MEDDDGDYKVTPDHWTRMLDIPGHWLQYQVSNQIEAELTRFYGLNLSKEEWKKSKGFKHVEDAIKKFPDDEKTKIIDCI